MTAYVYIARGIDGAIEGRAVKVLEIVGQQVVGLYMQVEAQVGKALVVNATR